MAGLGKSRAQEEARKLLQRFDVVAPPVPVERMTHWLGINLQSAPLDEELSGMIFKRDGQCIIGVNSVHHPNRQRFTIAHEIGHFILHPKLIDYEVHVDKSHPVLWRDSVSAEGIDPREMDANAFAAELLMPRAMLDRYVDRAVYLDEDDDFVRELAAIFRVSQAAMRNRLISLYESSF